MQRRCNCNSNMYDWRVSYEVPMCEDDGSWAAQQLIERQRQEMKVAITATDSGGKDFKKVPPGCHFAICNMVVDLGVQASTYMGKEKSQHKIYIRWEVPDERVSYEKDGKEVEGPCSIGATYTLSLSEKANLRKVLENWRGQPFTAEELRGFDVTTIAGKCCQIMVQHEQSGDKTYANVTGVMGTSRDQKERARTAKSEVGVLVYSIGDSDQETFDKLPNWLKEKIEGRVKPVTAKAATAAPADFDDDIPF